MPAINPKEMIEQKKREAVAKKKPAAAAAGGAKKPAAAGGAAKTTKKAAPPKPRVKKEKKPVVAKVVEPVVINKEVAEAGGPKVDIAVWEKYRERGLAQVKVLKDGVTVRLMFGKVSFVVKPYGKDEAAGLRELHVSRLSREDEKKAEGMINEGAVCRFCDRNKTGTSHHIEVKGLEEGVMISIIDQFCEYGGYDKKAEAGEEAADLGL